MELIHPLLFKFTNKQDLMSWLVFELAIRNYYADATLIYFQSYVNTCNSLFTHPHPLSPTYTLNLSKILNSLDKSIVYICISDLIAHLHKSISVRSVIVNSSSCSNIWPYWQLFWAVPTSSRDKATFTRTIYSLIRSRPIFNGEWQRLPTR